MKKILSFLLVATMLLSLCACGSSNAAPTENTPVLGEGLNIGYGKADITPSGSVPLAGYGNANDRMSTSVVAKIFATCIAMTEGDETVLLFTQDMTKSVDYWTDAVRSKIETELGIPGNRVMICSTHTHTAPETYSNNPVILEYQKLYLQAMVEAAKAALADRSPATISGVKTEAPDMAFVRHYTTSDGQYTDNTNVPAGAVLVGHPTEADDEMILVKFDREGDKKDVLLVNWQVHPDHSSALGFTSISADFIGPMRDKLEADTGMEVAYFTGDTGNQTAHSRIRTEENGLDWREYGEKLAQIATEALPNLTPIEGKGIKASQVKFTYAMNHANEDKFMEAKEVVALGNNEAGKALAKKYGIETYNEASNILARMDRPAEDTVELNTFYVAGMAFITAPFELFSDTGIHIKENSPFKFTLLFTNANDWNSYLAPEYAYEYVSYESSAGHLAKGAAEAVLDKYMEMLNGLK